MLHVYFLKLTLEREEGRERRERERTIDLLFHLFTHSLVASRMGPDRGWDLQPWCTRATLSPTELPGQGCSVSILNRKGMEAKKFQGRIPITGPLCVLTAQKAVIKKKKKLLNNMVSGDKNQINEIKIRELGGVFSPQNT